MKRTMLMTAAALLISAGLSAQNATRTQTQTQAEKQNRSAATIQTQTQGQYQNYGQMTSEQKQLRNEERKALRKQQKELKKQQKQLRNQEASMNHEQLRDQTRANTGYRGARNTTPMRNTSRGPGQSGSRRK
jgi:uncharacterized cupredoxin-like copper-binding protein